jgi:hypothetical protein
MNDEQLYLGILEGARSLELSDGEYRFNTVMPILIPSGNHSYLDSSSKILIYNSLLASDTIGDDKDPVEVKLQQDEGEGVEMSQALLKQIYEIPVNCKTIDYNIKLLACLVASAQVGNTIGFAEPRIMNINFGSAKYRVFVVPNREGIFIEKGFEAIIPE